MKRFLIVASIGFFTLSSIGTAFAMKVNVKIINYQTGAIVLNVNGDVQKIAGQGGVWQVGTFQVHQTIMVTIPGSTAGNSFFYFTPYCLKSSGSYCRGDKVIGTLSTTPDVAVYKQSSNRMGVSPTLGPNTFSNSKTVCIPFSANWQLCGQTNSNGKITFSIVS